MTYSLIFPTLSFAPDRAKTRTLSSLGAIPNLAGLPSGSPALFGKLRGKGVGAPASRILAAHSVETREAT